MKWYQALEPHCKQIKIMPALALITLPTLTSALCSVLNPSTTLKASIDAAIAACEHPAYIVDGVKWFTLDVLNTILQKIGVPPLPSVVVKQIADHLYQRAFDDPTRAWLFQQPKRKNVKNDQPPTRQDDPTSRNKRRRNLRPTGRPDVCPLPEPKSEVQGRSWD